MSMRFWRCCLYINERMNGQFWWWIGWWFQISIYVLSFQPETWGRWWNSIQPCSGSLGNRCGTKHSKKMSLDLEGFNDLHELLARGHKPCHVFCESPPCIPKKKLHHDWLNIWELPIPSVLWNGNGLKSVIPRTLGRLRMKTYLKTTLKEKPKMKVDITMLSFFGYLGTYILYKSTV